MSGFIISDDDTTVVERMTPEPDGARVAFYTSFSYRGGSVSLWVNGIRKIEDWEDGFNAPGGIVITLNEAPQAGDSVQVQYNTA